jgi:hypothetical protein
MQTFKKLPKIRPKAKKPNPTSASNAAIEDEMLVRDKD